MRRLLPELEDRAQPLIPPRQFIVRLAQSGILVAGVILAPVAHRILHRFHMESRNK